MKKKIEEFRMPDGTWTSDAVKMGRAWKKIYKPICKELGVKVIGYDPGILFSCGNQSFNLPVSIAIKLNELITYHKKTIG